MNETLSFLGSADPAVIDALYRQYCANPFGVEPSWRRFFEGYQFSQWMGNGHVAEAQAPHRDVDADHGRKEIAVLRLVHDYRMRGHLFTKTNPVRERRRYQPSLELRNYELSDGDLGTTFQGGREVGLGPAPLREIVDLLQLTYCRSIGVEYKYVDDTEMIRWFEDQMESRRNEPNFSVQAKRDILQKMAEAVLLEQYLHRQFVGQKRFSLEGVEALIPALDQVLLTGSTLGAQEFVIGMAHRGRLNVLANILGKPCAQIFAEFGGSGVDSETFDGDVKYHMGYSSDQQLRNGCSVHLSLMPNPSHLEAVGPVAVGAVRSKLDAYYPGDLKAICPILIHGDAAIAGQGVVYELLQMSQLDGYRVGGTVHLVLNNQLGFTTHYLDGRSSTYCTDVAKVTRSPVFHVNADDAEAVVYAVQLAMEFRQRFHRDVFVDLLGYRKHGHNEGDEPRFTQPMLYSTIATHPDPFKIYAEQLLADGSVSTDDVSAVNADYQHRLDAALEASKAQTEIKIGSFFERHWTGMTLPTQAEILAPVDTAVAESTLREVGHAMLTLPVDRPFYRKIVKLFEHQRAVFDAGQSLNWALGEWLAYATLLTEGTRVRLSGQDCERGTFSHRHAVLTLKDSEEEYVPLNHLSAQQQPLEIYNSPLSEYAALGFEFGYTMANPEKLVIWEAQFGDFVNGAQIIIDQFIATAETKWQRMSGLVLLLPHGHEGQGPEHSSARPERFLQLCADNLLQVVVPSTPASLFHLLRRQMRRNFRRPLIVMTPKSLLRHPACVSPLSDFATGGFREMLDDTAVVPKKVRRVCCCAGKIYYDLVAQRDQSGREDVAIIRLEQLYPFPQAQLEALQKKYNRAKEWRWVQEEPVNMGAWTFVQRMWERAPWSVVARAERASPATGFPQHHAEQQAALVSEALKQ